MSALKPKERKKRGGSFQTFRPKAVQLFTKNQSETERNGGGPNSKNIRTIFVKCRPDEPEIGGAIKQRHTPAGGEETVDPVGCHDVSKADLLLVLTGHASV